MSTSVQTANSILELIYKATAWADVAENDGSSPATQLAIALHTAAPASNAQTSNEATYTNYGRVNVSRSGTGWGAASGGSIENAAEIAFPECGVTGNTITHVSIGIGGTIIHYGALGSSRAISSGIQPVFAAGALISTIT